MNKILSIFCSVFFVGLMAVVYSCTQEDSLTEPNVGEECGWHSAKVKFNISRAVFDQSADGTRATDEGWKDGDVVYLLLTDKDGNKVQAYVRYDASEGWSDVMYDGYKSNLLCASERKAEAYYMEGVNDLHGETFELSNDKAIYVCTEGTYIYPSDNEMTVSVTLVPLTGRVRFEGTQGTTATVNGLKTYSSFSRTTGEFTTSTENVSTTVASNGSTPYIYSVFADETSPTMFVTSDATYKTVFDASSSVLKPGKSGFLTLPTSADHRGWMTIVPVTGIMLDKTSVSLVRGYSVQLTATFSPDNANDKSVTWTSSNTSVATVDNSGKVTAMANGTATITVQSVSNSNIKATCQVTVLLDRTFTVGGVTFTMKLVEAGTFQMGSTENSNEQPVHGVTITKDYYIGETEVTQALWYAVMGYSPTSDGSAWSSSYGLGDNYPTYYINYVDVLSFLTKLNSITGEQFRMPTEAEWEFAARGGNKSKGYAYSGSNTIDDVAWYGDNSNEKTHPVKTKAANELGIYDMSGNVWEWCSDWYGTYSSSAQVDPTGPTTGSLHVSRGGGWDDYATWCRCACRNGCIPSYRLNYFGVRLAL